MMLSPAPALACRCAVKAVQEAAPSAQVFIYVRNGVTAEQLVADASARFNIKIPKPIRVRFNDVGQPPIFPKGTNRRSPRCCALTFPPLCCPPR